MSLTRINLGKNKLKIFLHFFLNIYIILRKRRGREIIQNPMNVEVTERKWESEMLSAYLVAGRRLLKPQ